MLGRLTYESNPETKVNQYFYDSLTGDANCGTASSPGDLVKTIDQNGNVACLTYDGLHRVLNIIYAAGPNTTPSKYFVYDSAVVNGTTMGLTEGRLAEAYTCTTCTPNPTKLTDIGFTYSARGELISVYESTPHSGGYYQVNASYWAHGLLSSLTLVGTSLPTIYYGGSTGLGLDGEGRVTSVTASSGTATLANNVIYTTSGTTQPIGSLTSVTLGSGDSDAFGYDTLTGRLTKYIFNMNGSTAKTWGLTWNANGSLGTLALTDNVTPANAQTCSYSHDDLARIASASCVNGSTMLWSQTFAFDPFGNIDKTATTGTSFLPTYNLATNRYSSIPGCTPSYDSNGDLLNGCSHTYLWLADGSVAKVDTVALTYDALGRAVEQKRGSSYTQIVYTPSGRKLALMNGTTMEESFIPLPGGGTAVYTVTSNGNVAYYRHADWLGSSRLASTPVTPTTVYADTEYAPYGESYGVTGALDLNFTGQNQDTVPSSTSGLYDFLFREYDPQQSRWIRPDRAGLGAVNPAVPQTWNRYAYVGNSPLNVADKLGLFLGPCLDACHYDVQMDRTAGFYSEFQLFQGSGQLYDRWQFSDDDGPVEEQWVPVNFWGQSFENHPSEDGWTYLGLGAINPDPVVTQNTSVAAANNGTPQTPQQPRPHGCGLAIAQGALSVGLDVVGAIPGFGNAVSATAAGARAVNGIVAYGGAAYGIGTGLGDESPVGAASAGAGLGLTLADAALEGGKVIPVVGNILSVATGLYDGYQLAKTIQKCW